MLQTRRPSSLIRAAIAVAMAVPLACGCGPATQPAAGIQPSWVHVTERFAPSPPVARRTETVQLRLTDGAGRPLRHAQVAWSASMDMPGMVPAATRLVPGAAGIYSGSTVFVMAGPWTATVEVTAGGRHTAITLDFGVNE